MAKILVNYILNKSKDTFEILSDSRYVFADQPVAVFDTEDDIVTPLVVPIRGVMTVVDKARYELTNKKFRLVADDKGIVSEHPNGVEIWLPKDTDISKLRYVNNQLVLVQEEPEKAEEVKEEVKKANKKKSVKKEE